MSLRLFGAGNGGLADGGEARTRSSSMDVSYVRRLGGSAELRGSAVPRWHQRDRSGSLPLVNGAPRVRPLEAVTDGVVTLRRPSAADRAAFRTGRDYEFRRWLGDGSDDPRPTASIVVGGETVGWIDFDADRAWLYAGEVNVGYALFPLHRGHGYVSRAVELLLQYLAESTPYDTATLLIEPGNVRSLAVAQRTHFREHAPVQGGRYFKRSLQLE
jgi:RimJ/RimL family protein N-acetyltransferase